MTTFDAGGPAGTFCWIDLNAPDMQAAVAWYGELFGWRFELAGADGGPPYGMFLLDGDIVAGVGQMSDEMKRAGVPPVWNNYVAVQDCGEIEKRVVELGGKVVVPTMKVSDAGTLAFFTDPGGASFAVWQAGEHCGGERFNDPGCLSWNELATRDITGAKAFYGGLFGWSFDDTQPVPGVNYTVIKIGARDNGGFIAMNEQWGDMPPHWMAYIAVSDVDAAAVKVDATGGKVHVPPTDIAVGRFSVVADPQGGIFTMIELSQARRAEG